MTLFKRILLESIFVFCLCVTSNSMTSPHVHERASTGTVLNQGITPIAESVIKTTLIVYGTSLKIDDSSSKLFNDIEYLFILFKRVIKNIHHTTIRIYIDKLLTIVHKAIENSEIYENDVIKMQNLFDLINDLVNVTKIFYGKYSIPQLVEAISQVKKTFKCSDLSLYSSFQTIYLKFESFFHILSNRINELTIN